MKQRFKKFLWSPTYWGLCGVVGCVSGLYFEQAASNGLGLWLLGVFFLGAAYVERRELAS
jgi:hypothetical protein